MNRLIEFAKDNRTTTFFRSKAILEIRVAYKIMEYLAPDDHFPPVINTFTKDLILRREYGKAYEYIIEELDLDRSTDLGCSLGEERLRADAIELMAYLLPLYEKDCTDKKEKRRIELLKELRELDGGSSEVTAK